MTARQKWPKCSTFCMLSGNKFLSLYRYQTNMLKEDKKREECWRDQEIIFWLNCKNLNDDSKSTASCWNLYWELETFINSKTMLNGRGRCFLYCGFYDHVLISAVWFFLQCNIKKKNWEFFVRINSLFGKVISNLSNKFLKIGKLVNKFIFFLRIDSRRHSCPMHNTYIICIYNVDIFIRPIHN